MKKGEIHLSRVILIVFLIIVITAVVWGINNRPQLKHLFGGIDYENECTKIEVKPLSCDAYKGIIVVVLSKNNLSIPINKITAILRNPTTEKFHLADLKYIPEIGSNVSVYIENSFTQTQWATASAEVSLKMPDGANYACPAYKPEIPCSWQER